MSTEVPGPLEEQLRWVAQSLTGLVRGEWEPGKKNW